MLVAASIRRVSRDVCAETGGPRDATRRDAIFRGGHANSTNQPVDVDCDTRKNGLVAAVTGIV